MLNRGVTLVTGGAGFVGRHLVDLLRDRGAAVRVLDLQSRPPSGDSEVEWVVGSITDREVVRRAMEGAGHVFHLAADPELWARDKRSFHRVNAEGTRIVLEEAERAGVERIVHTSTESILRSRRDRGGAVDESMRRDASEMIGPYCRSKFLAEEFALAAAARGLPVVVVNPTMPLGPGDHRLTPPTRMLLDFLTGRARAYLDFALNVVHVRDVARGHVLAAERGRSGQRYILGGDNLRMPELLALIERASGRAMPRIRVPWAVALAFAAASEVVADLVTRRPPLAPLAGVRLARAGLIFDTTRAREELGLVPTPAALAVADAVAWLRGEGYW